MKTSSSYCRQRHIEKRVIELEKALTFCEDFKIISIQEYSAFQKLKTVLGDRSWLVLDEYICARNAEFEYVINYFYEKGLSDANVL